MGYYFLGGFIALDTLPLNKKYYSRFTKFCISKIPLFIKMLPEKEIKKGMAKSICATKYSYDKTMEMLKPFSKEEIIEQMSAIFKAFLKEDISKKFNCPGVVLVSELDKIAGIQKQCKNWAKDSKFPLQIIKDAGHFSNSDNEMAVNYEIEVFIESITK